MPSQQQHAVRQVLMNELGLTRDAVREEITRIVTETVERYLGSDQMRQFETRLIETIAAKLRKTWTDPNLTSMIEREIRQQVGNLVQKHLIVEIAGSIGGGQ